MTIEDTQRAMKKADLLLEVYNNYSLVRDPYTNVDGFAEKYVLVEKDEGRSNVFYARELLNELVAEGHVIKMETPTAVFWRPAYQKLTRYTP